MLLVLGMASTSRAAWVTYINQTATRMPTGAGQNDPALTTLDPRKRTTAGAMWIGTAMSIWYACARRRSRLPAASATCCT
jgi:hypothetical protein